MHSVLQKSSRDYGCVLHPALTTVADVAKTLFVHLCSVLLQEGLNKETPARAAGLTEDELQSIKGLGMLTLKPIIYAANVADGDLAGERADCSSVPVCPRMMKCAVSGVCWVSFWHTYYLCCKCCRLVKECWDVCSQVLCTCRCCKESRLIKGC